MNTNHDSNRVDSDRARRTPVLFVEAIDEQRAGGWCVYCGRYHIHGRPPPDGPPYYPAPHCVYGAQDSPYLQTGYRLVEVGPVGTLPKPRRVYKLVYTRDGRMLSGFLATQRKALLARAGRARR